MNRALWLPSGVILTTPLGTIMDCGIECQFSMDWLICLHMKSARVGIVASSKAYDMRQEARLCRGVEKKCRGREGKAIMAHTLCKYLLVHFAGLFGL
ncbi:hypothetical protein IF2G_10613 [Cordyceps javanica]|nr:hypothetical protein IF2G_10613 [Cordyceps javanica]